MRKDIICYIVLYFFYIGLGIYENESEKYYFKLKQGGISPLVFIVRIQRGYPLYHKKR